MDITAVDLIDIIQERKGVIIDGLDVYAFEAKKGNGYLTYPSTGSGYDAAMPEDTVVVTVHDNNGNENYLLLNPDFPMTVSDSPW